jgi:hypothetical protein
MATTATHISQAIEWNAQAREARACEAPRPRASSLSDATVVRGFCRRSRKRLTLAQREGDPGDDL